MKIIIALFVLLFSVSVAQAYEKGDIVWLSYICKTEEALMSVVKVDIEDFDEAVIIMRAYFKMQECVMMPPPGIRMLVHSVVVDYVDSQGTKSQMLEVTGLGKDQTKFYALVTLEEDKSST